MLGHGIPLIAPLRGRRLFTTPADGSRSVSRLLQDFPESRPCYEERAGPLETPCWVWLGHLNPQGYPERTVNKQRLIVHRAVLAATVGPLDASQQAHHVCENKLCVNPAHLKALTQAEHVREHLGRETAVEAALPWIGLYPRSSPSSLAARTGHSSRTMAVALWRAERTGRIRRVRVGEDALIEEASRVTPPRLLLALAAVSAVSLACLAAAAGAVWAAAKGDVR